MITTNAHVTVEGNELFDPMSYTVPNILVFTDAPEDIETARRIVMQAVQMVFQRPVTVTFDFEK